MSKKIETLQELKAEILRLKQVKDDLLTNYPELKQTWFYIENVSVEVLFDAQSFFQSTVTEKGDKIRLQYCRFDMGNEFILFAYSGSVVKKIAVPLQLTDFAEAS